MTDKQIFFYLFNRRSYAGDLELLKKKKVEEKKKGISRGWVGVRALEDVCGSKTDPSGLLAYPTAFVIPARATFFPPKLLHTKESESF